MKAEASVIRGTPFYAKVGNERIALVPEIVVSRKPVGNDASAATLTILKPAAIFVIDRVGVKRLAIGSPSKGRLAMIALSSLVGPALYLLVRSGRKND